MVKFLGGNVIIWTSTFTFLNFGTDLPLCSLKMYRPIKKNPHTPIWTRFTDAKKSFLIFFIVLIKSTTNKLASYDSLNLKLTVIRRNWIIILHRYNFVCNQFGFCNNFIIYSVICHLAMRNSIHLMQDECKISHDTPAGRTI